MRLATVADIDGMHAVRMAVRENRLADTSRVAVEDYRRKLEGHSRGWVHEEAGEIVAFGIVDLSERNIWALFVAPGFERSGIGSALLAKMVEYAFENGKGPLWLTTSPNTRAEGFYRAAGWQQADIDGRGDLRLELTFCGFSNGKTDRGKDT